MRESSLFLRYRKIELMSEIAISRDVYLIAPSIFSFPRYFSPTRRMVQEVKIVRVLREMKSRWTLEIDGTSRKHGQLVIDKFL